MSITLSQAESVAAAARAGAEERGVPVALAVVDAGGHLVAFARADGAPLITVDTAIGKAFTAISIGADTVDLTPAIQPGAPLFGTGLILAGSRSLVPYGGGVVIRDGGGRVVGAVGVSGAPDSAVDHEIAAAAAAAHAGAAETVAV